MEDAVSQILGAMDVDLTDVLVGAVSVFGAVLMVAIAFCVSVKLCWQVADWFSDGAVSAGRRTDRILSDYQEEKRIRRKEQRRQLKAFDADEFRYFVEND